MSSVYDFNKYITQWAPKSVTDTNQNINAKNIGVTGPLSINTKDLHSLALSSSKAQSDLKKSAFKLQTCEESDFQINTAEKTISGGGFSIKETKTIKPKNATPNNVSKSGASTLSPMTRGSTCGTSTGVTNLNLSFNCNFVAGMNLDNCLLPFELTFKIYTKKLAKYIWSLGIEQVPVLAYATKLGNHLCSMFSQISRIICFVRQLISCILGTIKSIIQVIQWIISLPLQFIQYLISCVSSFLNNILTSLNLSVNTLLSTFNGLFNCAPYNCKENISSLDEITDISNVSSDFTNAAYGIGDASSELIG